MSDRAFAEAWERFVDSRDYRAAIYYAATPEARDAALVVAFRAGFAAATHLEKEISPCES